jgi:hypothetical protein
VQPDAVQVQCTGIHTLNVVPQTDDIGMRTDLPSPAALVTFPVNEKCHSRRLAALLLDIPDVGVVAYAFPGDRARTVLDVSELVPVQRQASVDSAVEELSLRADVAEAASIYGLQVRAVGASVVCS